MSDNLPPPSVDDLVRDVRAIAFDKTLDDADRARRLRDRIREHDGEDFGDEVSS